jgi:uncharacterized protein GlcG (DUF336 family)
LAGLWLDDANRRSGAALAHGVSGDTSDTDEACAAAGIAAIGRAAGS